MSYLSDTFYLNRAGRYSSPLNSNDRLPLIYGDLTDGSMGIWTLPCINTSAYVYCFAGHEVISAANGNSISIYADGVLVSPANYTFNACNNYGSLGNIATVTFTSDQGISAITARGKGKPTTSGGSTLMDNIVDIVNDFLTVENDFSGSLFESTLEALASQVFSSQGYEAAGVIPEDAKIWDIITEMMASFLGSAFLNGSGELVLDIDNGFISQYSASVIRKSGTTLVDAEQRLVNIINQCPCHYAYNYAAGEFKRETDDSSHTDTASQGIYGVRKPDSPYQFYWCRDLTSVQKIQDIIVAKFRNPLYEIEIENNSLKYVELDQGDIFIYSVDSLYDENGDELLNHYWKIISVSPDFQAGKIKFRALQTNYYLSAPTAFGDGTILGDGTVMGGGARVATIY